MNLQSVFAATEQWALSRQLVYELHAQLASTNDLAKEKAHSEAAEFKLYCADWQTAGRGRGTRRWTSPKRGHSLLSSWSFALTRSPQPIASPLMGLALFSAAEKIWPQLPWSLKAPNDLYLGSGKVAGLLLEAHSLGRRLRLVIGLGLNVLSHPEEVDIATHLCAGSGPLTENQWSAFLDQLLLEFRQALSECVNNQLDAKARQNLIRALNAHPLNKAPYQEVTAQGDLIRDNEVLPWQSL